MNVTLRAGVAAYVVDEPLPADLDQVLRRELVAHHGDEPSWTGRYWFDDAAVVEVVHRGDVLLHSTHGWAVLRPRAFDALFTIVTPEEERETRDRRLRIDWGIFS